jgi:hypothetical protein
MTYPRRFARFLYDFLVGDAWELFAGPLLALGLAWLALQAGLAPSIAGGLLVVSVIAVAAIHVGVALRTSS